MNILEKNQIITPHKVSLCILLHDVLTNTQIPQKVCSRLLQFLTDQILMQKEELNYQGILSELRALDHEEYRISEKLETSLESIENYTDLLSLFLVKLEELKSYGDIPTHLLEQGGALFSFVIKVFITFTRMGFEDLTKLEKEVQAYKLGEYSQNEYSVRSIASNINRLLTEKTYDELIRIISSMKEADKYILLSHVDSIYGNISAIDHVHRYFDSVLDKYMPTKTTRERGLVVVHSSTHFASLKRVKVELEVGHLDIAIHLLVETIKRALSENDNLAILESTLLFMRIASIIGNHKQEIKLCEKSVLHALKIQSVLGLVKASLCYLNLEGVYQLPRSDAIIKAITPQPTAKKLNLIQKKELSLHRHIKPSINLISYTLVKSVENGKFKDFFQNSLEINTILWKELSPWLSNCYFSFLRESFPKSLSSHPDCNFYLKIVRNMATENKAAALSLLTEIDAACLVKKAIDWEFTICYLNAVWGLHLGELKEAEYFEKQAMSYIRPLRSPENIIIIKLLSVERLIYQKNYTLGFTRAIKLLSECIRRDLNREAAKCSLLLSIIYLNTSEYIKAYTVLKEALEYTEKAGEIYLLLKIQLGEVYLDLYPHCSACLDELSTIEEIVSSNDSIYIKGLFHFTKGKGLLSISKKFNDDINQRLFSIAISHCINAVNYMKELNFLWEIREIYYVLARGYHEIADQSKRDEAAREFCNLNRTINILAKRTTSRVSSNSSVLQTSILVA